MILLLFCHTSYGQAPEDYYNDAFDKSGLELKAVLHTITKGHIEFPYSGSDTDVWDILKETDRDTANGQNVIGIYSAFSMNAAAEYNRGKGWNREHVWAKSRGNFGTSKGAGTDVHHIRAADISTNSARNNRNFDESTIPYTDKGGSYNGPTDCYTSDTAWIWEPREEVKGDIARMLFYMAVRYEGTDGEPDLELTEEHQDASGKSPFHAKLSILIAWHLADPVDEYEKRRNNIIYFFQKNRNPFIDHPEFVCRIWISQCDALTSMTK
ncbi:MAG: endonuclease I family protein [Candidatus Cyclobacteriaceae bacterium M2_1C_046]